MRDVGFYPAIKHQQRQGPEAITTMAVLPQDNAIFSHRHWWIAENRSSTSKHLLIGKQPPSCFNLNPHSLFTHLLSHPSPNPTLPHVTLTLQYTDSLSRPLPSVLSKTLWFYPLQKLVTPAFRSAILLVLLQSFILLSCLQLLSCS